MSSRRTPRKVSNRSDDDLIVVIVGGKDGYVARDGQLVSPEDLEKRQALREESSDGRPDDGHAADAADAAPPLRALLRRQGDRHPHARPELPPDELCGDRSPRARARGRAAAARSRTRRPRRNAVLEPPRPPRGLPRYPVRRLRAAHAQPAPASERPRLHRDPRERQGRDRRPQPGAAARPFPREHEDRARARRRGLVRGAARLRRSRHLARSGAETRTKPPRCVTRAARPGCRRACSTRTARRCCTRSASRRGTRWVSASARQIRSCPSCRCSTRTRGATRTSRR